MKKSKLNQVGNFEKLVSFINAQGPVYNPSKASINVAALQTLLTQAQGAIQAADVSRTAYETALNARHHVFDIIPKQARRVIAVLKSSGVSQDVIDDAMVIKRRFTSQAKKAVINSPSPALLPATSGSLPDADEGKYRRRLSQLDKDCMIGNFQRLVIRATAEPMYEPNESDLQVPALNAFVTTLRERNKMVIDAFITMREANQVVDKLLYDTTGIHGTAKATKAYIESIFGFGSMKHKEITSLTFRNR